MDLHKFYYSSLKIFHHQTHIDALRRGDHPAPIHVQIIPTNRCQQRCRFCSYRAAGYSSNEQFDTRSEIPIAKLLELVADCKALGVRAIELTGGGEPTCHPEFLRLCQAIMEAGMDLGLVTNGALWTPAHTATLFHAKWVRFSIDSGCRETYATMRRANPSSYDKVRAVVRDLAAAKSNNGPLIGVGFVVTADNWNEVVQATQRARDDGADNFRISAVFQNGGTSYFDSFGMSAATHCRQAETLQTDSFRVFNLFDNRLSDLRDGKPSYRECGFQRFCTYIGADLRVYRCCVISYNQIGLLGSVGERSFSDLWRSSETATKLREFDARVCPRCMFHEKNNAIAYALLDSPPHVNFL